MFPFPCPEGVLMKTRSDATEALLFEELSGELKRSHEHYDFKMSLDK